MMIEGVVVVLTWSKKIRFRFIFNKNTTGFSVFTKFDSPCMHYSTLTINF